VGQLTAAEVLASVFSLALLSWIALGLVAVLRTRTSVGNVAIAAPIAFVATWAILMELLSLTVGISRTTITVTALTLGVVVLVAYRTCLRGARLLAIDLRRGVAAMRAPVFGRPWWRWIVWTSAVLALAALVISFFVALISPPNNPDALSYHLPRVMWWLQQGHVGSYVSPDPRELAFPPLNSYLLLVLRATSGADLTSGLLQWSAAAASVAAAVVMARRLFNDRLTVVLTGVIAATIPTGIAVATTTKADWLAALWPVLAAAVVVSRATGRMSFRPAVLLLATSAALAMATKPTSALAAALPIAVGIWFEFRGTHPAGRVLAPLSSRLGRAGIVAVAGLSGAVIGGLPQTLRTIALYGSATGPDLDIMVRRFDLSIVWGNVVRTLLNNVGVPPMLSGAVNERLPHALSLIGVPWTDPDALHFDAVLQMVIGRNEDFATNPIHVLLGLAACVVVLATRRAPVVLRYLSGMTLFTFVILVGAVQWNLWTTRFLLGTLVLAALPLAWLLAWGLRSSRLRPTLAGVLASIVLLVTAVYGFAISVAQEYRPLIGANSILTTSRLDQYFAVNDRPGTKVNWHERITTEVDRLSSLPAGSVIGVAGLGAQEYLVWQFLNPDGRYEFVSLDGVDGSRLPVPDRVDAILCLDNCEGLPTA
jgi:hypothetical protein